MKHLFLLLATTMLTFNVWAQEFDGAGTADNPYLINNKEDLARLAVLVNEGNTEYRDAAYRLTADIDLAGDNWVPIGTSDNPFQGQFDGDNHTIHNLTIKGTGITYAGLFGYVDSANSEFKNLKFVGGEIQIDGNSDSNSYAGFLVGYINNEGKGVDNCSSTGNVTTTAYDYSYVGGLVGRTYSSISNCHSTGDIMVTSVSVSLAGGLVGETDSSINDCYAMGDVTATSLSLSAVAGGLVGFSESIINCYATGDVMVMSASPYSYAGGLTGRTHSPINSCYAIGNATTTASSQAFSGGLIGRTSSSISDCYATGDAAATAFYESFAGGLVGQAGSSLPFISNCYATGDITATSYSPYPSSYSYAGGLTGWTSCKTTASVAANNSLTGEGANGEVYIGRVAGASQPTSIIDCYYRETMVLIGPRNENAVFGQAATASDLISRAFYANLGWDMDNIWSIEEGVELPRLRSIPEQPTSINTSSIASQENNVRVYYDGNSIVVAGANAGETIHIYNVSGALVKTQNIASPQTSIALPQGVYIVKVGSAAFKVISSKF